MTGQTERLNTALAGRYRLLRQLGNGGMATALALAFLALPIAPVRAQSTTVIDGPAAPVTPAVITRDAAQRATVRAIKLSAPLTLDGVLDEAVYTKEAPFGGLIQVAPHAG